MGIVQLSSVEQNTRFYWRNKEESHSAEILSLALMEDDTIEPVVFCCARVVPIISHIREEHMPKAGKWRIAIRKDIMP